MKKIFTSVLMLGLIALSTHTYATNFIVTAQNYFFTPDSFTCFVGDTVTWQWIDNVHEPASTTIPNGAAPWTLDVSSSSPTAFYVVTVAGTYNYQCNFHFQDGMIGKFVALPVSTPPVIHNFIVTAQNYFFTPDSFTCFVGDTVTWQWIDNVHEPASTTIPVGAAPWTLDVSSSSPTAFYVVTVAGTYNYQCNFHFQDGMIGKFIALPVVATGVPTIVNDDAVKFYPVPFQSNLTVDISKNAALKGNVTIEVFNSIGQREFLASEGQQISAPVNLNLSFLAAGIHFLGVSDDNGRKTYKLVKSE